MGAKADNHLKLGNCDAVKVNCRLHTCTLIYTYMYIKCSYIQSVQVAVLDGGALLNLSKQFIHFISIFSVFWRARFYNTGEFGLWPFRCYFCSTMQRVLCGKLKLSVYICSILGREKLFCIHVKHKRVNFLSKINAVTEFSLESCFFRAPTMLS